MKKGFTLVEVMVATFLVGLAVSALIGANISFTQANSAAVKMSTAEFLLEQVREMSALLPFSNPDSSGTFGPESDETSVSLYDDLDDFYNTTFSPPINANRVTLNHFDSYTQHVMVESVSAGDFELPVTNGASDFLKITVTVKHNSQPICNASWIRADLK